MKQIKQFAADDAGVARALPAGFEGTGGAFIDDPINAESGAVFCAKHQGTNAAVNQMVCPHFDQLFGSGHLNLPLSERLKIFSRMDVGIQAVCENDAALHDLMAIAAAQPVNGAFQIFHGNAPCLVACEVQLNGF